MKAIIALAAPVAAVQINAEGPALVSIKSFQHWRPVQCAKEWDALPGNAKTYTQRLISDLCTNGVAAGQAQQCTSWEPVMEQVVCGVMANPECPATTFSKADCKKCFNRKQENNKAWTGLSADEKAWMTEALMGRGKNAEYPLGKFQENVKFAMNRANETARDSGMTAKVKVAEPLGDNNDSESIEVSTMEKLHGEALYCALRITVLDKCGTQLDRPSCASAPDAAFFEQKAKVTKA